MSLSAQELVAVCIFMGVAAGTFLLLAIFDPYWSQVRDRVKALHSSGPVALGGGALPKSRAAGSWWGSDLAKQAFGLPSHNRGRLLQRLTKAGVYGPSGVSRFFTMKLLLTLIPPLIAVGVGCTDAIRMDKALLAGCVAGGVGSLLPGLWLDRAAARRHILWRESLPDFLDLMIVCLEGGMSLQETVRRVGDELRLAHPALAFELTIVQRDIELGATVDQALKRFAARTEYDGIRSLSTFIREAQRFGTNITEALRGHADMLRSQREQAAEECAQKASVKILIPTMLLIFPAIFVVLVGPAAVQIYEAFGKK